DRQDGAAGGVPDPTGRVARRLDRALDGGDEEDRHADSAADAAADPRRGLGPERRIGVRLGAEAGPETGRPQRPDRPRGGGQRRKDPDRELAGAEAAGMLTGGGTFP